jgi:hypothetical protein
VLETEGRRKGKRCKRLGYVQSRLSSVWHTGLSGGAPDSVRCARLNSSEHASLGRSLATYGYNSLDCPVVHRTVRWCTGLSGEPTVGLANGRSRNPRVTRGRANGQMGHRTVRCAPDSVRCAPDSVRCAPDSVRCANGSQTAKVDCAISRRKSGTGKCPVMHRTVRCTTRLKARFALLDCFQRLQGPLCL